MERIIWSIFCEVIYLKKDKVNTKQVNMEEYGVCEEDHHFLLPNIKQTKDKKLKQKRINNIVV